MAVSLAALSGLVAPPAASAALKVTIEPLQSKASTFRALKVEDVTRSSDDIEVTLSSYYDEEAANGFVEEMAITSPAGFLDPLPEGCYRPAAGNVVNDEDEPAFVCENGVVDLVVILAGRGKDEVSVTNYWMYPYLTLKQIFSPRTPVFMNVFLGAGADRFRTGPATDAVHGGAGKDLLAGGDGNDLVLGGPGADWLGGGEGTDIMFGGRGKDRCVGSGKDRGGGCERIKVREG